MSPGANRKGYRRDERPLRFQTINSETGNRVRDDMADTEGATAMRSPTAMSCKNRRGES
jgi:hypothetical protein